jgi:hypothetical protein
MQAVQRSAEPVLALQAMQETPNSSDGTPLGVGPFNETPNSCEACEAWEAWEAWEAGEACTDLQRSLPTLPNAWTFG